jgi:hypothetical protein
LPQIFGWRCFRARRSTQGGNRVEKLTAVPNNSYANILQVLCRQAQQDRVVDGVIAECLLILPEAKTPQPTPNVHDGALAPPLCAIIIYAKQRVQGTAFRK